MPAWDTCDMGSGTSRPRHHRRRRRQRKTIRGQRGVAKVEQGIAIQEQLQGTALSMEREPWARWVASGGMPRFLSMVIHRLKMKHRGEYVQPLPWLAVAVGGTLLAVVIGGIALIVYLAALN